MKEFVDPRETPYSPNQPPTSTTARKQDGQKQQAYGGASHAARPPAGSGKHFFAKERKEKPGRGDGRPNSKPSGMNDPYGIDIAPLNVFENQIIPFGYIIFQNHSYLKWPLLVFYLWGQSLFLNGGTPISNLLLGNLMISKEDCKTKCTFWKLHRVLFVWTNNFI